VWSFCCENLIANSVEVYFDYITVSLLRSDCLNYEVILITLRDTSCCDEDTQSKGISVIYI